jgi:hypothetical protein
LATATLTPPTGCCRTDAGKESGMEAIENPANSQ